MIEATNNSLEQLEELIEEEPKHIVGGSKNKQKKRLLNSFKLLDKFSIIIADAGYGSEENYQLILEEYEKTPLIPYTMYEKKQTRSLKIIHLIDKIGITMKRKIIILIT